MAFFSPFSRQWSPVTAAVCIQLYSVLHIGLMDTILFIKLSEITFFGQISKRQRVCRSKINHGLWTPNEGINQRNMKIWADVADKTALGVDFRSFIEGDFLSRRP